MDWVQVEVQTSLQCGVLCNRLRARLMCLHAGWYHTFVCAESNLTSEGGHGVLTHDSTSHCLLRVDACVQVASAHCAVPGGHLQ
jgi:hypothetical protein